jgi:hypothetical protein
MDYKFPHFSKSTLIQDQGVLPCTICMSEEAKETLETSQMYGVGDFN